MREYFINGWRESKAYFLSFGFTRSELERMESGEVINRADSVSNNTFSIKVIQEA